MKIQIMPSLLAADFGCLSEEIARVERAGADKLHVDVMDGHFVDNITIGPCIVEAIAKAATIPVDVHLMIEQPRRYLEAFIQAGADVISFHVEAADSPAEVIRMLHDRDRQAGLALNPETPVSALEPWLDQVDKVLVMTVEPGFGGQGMIEEALAKCATLRRRYSELDIQVNGGINTETIRKSVLAGANQIVAGTAIFRAAEPGAAIARLRALAEEAWQERRAADP